jgi:hypothetical protein
MAGKPPVLTHGECHRAVTTVGLVSGRALPDAAEKAGREGQSPAEGLEQATEGASVAGPPTR